MRRRPVDVHDTLQLQHVPGRKVSHDDGIQDSAFFKPEAPPALGTQLWKIVT
jgi:hypothetical protein